MYEKSKLRSYDSSGKREFNKELFALAIPFGLHNLLAALIGATNALMPGRLTQDAISAVSLAWGLSISMHSLIMGHLGTDATAAASITSVVQELITCVCKDVSAGTSIIIGKLLGKSMFDNAKAYGRKLWHISIRVGGIHMLLLCMIGSVATMFFILTETAKQYLIIMLLFTGIYVLAYSINTVIVRGIFPAGGNAK